MKNCQICYIIINFFAKFHRNLLKKFVVIAYISNWAFFGCSQSSEPKKYEMRTRTSVDNTVNDLHYEIKFENCVKDKNNLLSKTLLFFLEQK